ncbi:amidophosphoribosyltransferase [Caldivirga maquilingensis]|uniref:Amidophosphoribosyltransferase n=1 Tax=Caldivirga maquilingensis (strain ATCC 700844 / DSM 13496 / JCM 10307 / IC-167) TaxID=397948 RepID=A8MCK1_CALMQ|nr:amidophosphoribosyltransferase [Caldivirga maquilingensis]ABW01507.1 glutamine amidotransferase class-II [Caldivirga maquilingensis IC-167]
MCGIWAYLGQGANLMVSKMAPWLMHRGQEGFSYVCVRNGALLKVNDPIPLESNLCLGHARYSTSGPYGVELQPVVLGDLALVFNGTVANYKELKMRLREMGIIVNSNYDALILAQYLKNLLTRLSIDDTVNEVFKTIKGGYSILALWGNSLIAIRDPWGLRPLAMGITNDGVVFASETSVLDALGIKWIEVKPGNALVLGSNGERILNWPSVRRMYCALEYIYFQRPDSVFNGISIYSARRRLGLALARKEGEEVDEVSPIPETARVAAQAYANALGKPLNEFIVKNRFMGRGFIKPPKDRDFELYSVIKEGVTGKSVALIDDSIIRGTTLRRIIPKVKAAGAKAIHVRVSSPPVRYPCFMGMDFPSRRELIAHGKSIGEVKSMLGSDSLTYLTVDELKEAIGTVELCTACFTGEYPFKVNIDELEGAFTGDR